MRQAHESEFGALIGGQSLELLGCDRGGSRQGTTTEFPHREAPLLKRGPVPWLMRQYTVEERTQLGGNVWPEVRNLAKLPRSQLSDHLFDRPGLEQRLAGEKLEEQGTETERIAGWCGNGRSRSQELGSRKPHDSRETDGGIGPINLTGSGGQQGQMPGSVGCRRRSHGVDPTEREAASEVYLVQVVQRFGQGQYDGTRRRQIRDERDLLMQVRKATVHCRRDQHGTPCRMDSHIQDLHQRRVIQFHGTLSVVDKPIVIGNGARLDVQFDLHARLLGIVRVNS